MRRITWSLVSVVGLCGAIIAAQQAPPPSAQAPTFRTGTELVQLDVSVLDKHRRPVRGLAAADFTVLEDGKPQPITVFSAIEVPDRETVDTEWLRDLPADVVTNQIDDRRIMVIVFDDWSVGENMATFRAARASALRAIDELGPGDVAAVAFTLDTRFGQEFTMDRARLRRAVERQTLGFGAGPAGTFVGGCDCGLCSIQVLTEASRALQEISPSAEVDHLRQHRGGDQLLRRVDGSVCEPPAGRAQEGVSGRGARERHGVSGGPRRAARGDGVEDRHGVSADVARNTGGSAIINDNYPDRVVPRIFRENGSYYLLGYELRDAKPGGDFYRRLEVKVNRPDVEVRSRDLYYGPPTEKAVTRASSVSPLDETLVRLLPARDVALYATAAPFALPGRTDVPLVGPSQPGAPASAASRQTSSCRPPRSRSCSVFGSRCLRPAPRPTRASRKTCSCSSARLILTAAAAARTARTLASCCARLPAGKCGMRSSPGWTCAPVRISCDWSRTTPADIRRAACTSTWTFRISHARPFRFPA